MKFPGFTHNLTGVAVPVSALRSPESLGCGEFADLLPLAEWCKQTGLEVIQLLPINDTGSQSSPYFALTAFALHPMYLRVQDLPELGDLPDLAKKVKSKITRAKKTLNAHERMDYQGTLTTKMELVNTIFAEHADAILSSKPLADWIAANHWVKEYAVFKVLKAENQERSWVEWDSFQEPAPGDIEKRWSEKKLQREHMFHAWLQWRLENQLREVVGRLDEMDVFLKGDLPILMNEDSADVWAHRDIFITRLRAGAPPDMFSADGQNWGFPIYDWDTLAEQDYGWWKDRLRQSDKFYHAYRIDHVLGFFRIWSIPEANTLGTLGYFFPSAFIAQEELRRHGLDDARIRWLAEPHIQGEQIRDTLGEYHEAIVSRVFSQIFDQDLYTFSRKVHGEKFFDQLDIPDNIRGVLRAWYKDRALIEVEDGIYAPSWTFRECSRYHALSDHEKGAFEHLVATHANRSEAMWAENGRRLLSFMSQTVPMLTCAEDLGVIPDCVPQVLGELGILSLRIPRWSRDWNAPGQPYVSLQDYPALSVCTPSVHDTSTMREWWEREGEQEGFWHSLGFQEPCPGEFTADTAMRVYQRLLECNSQICMFQIQDLFVLDPELRVEDPGLERINVPGTLNDFNWTYRIPMDVQELKKYTTLNTRVAELTGPRAERTV
ncbi:4-alpha-glucanotransferase [Spirochaeta africana]|uniref:4-alpha-glucanotransferase n=1 Tax=Spirochaeta africana (strain ATCC 700263 / DSM 8902 / Z-7692) TaxID=889378 RepID=H9UFB7_SPIAZ|nr:4-alpha-glucanotransferase [Spirochaeta africana]AFG36210.1 4-alpha-glucanotransferase [Spirochaeta africana DSM 8902]